MCKASLMYTHKYSRQSIKNKKKSEKILTGLASRTNVYLPLEKHPKIPADGKDSANVNHKATECHIIDQYHYLHSLNIQHSTKGQRPLLKNAHNFKFSA